LNIELSGVLMSSTTANLIEVFSGIQGEGLNVGTRQIFIRFGSCDLRCHYCDSSHTWTKQPSCQIEQSPGQRDFLIYENPVSMEQLLEWVDRQNKPGLHDSISITGGEPLLHGVFLREFLPAVKLRTKLPIYLETGGHRPEQLSMVLKDIDLVGMDIKLPSVSNENHWKSHGQFLQLCHDRGCSIFIKMIISDRTTLIDLTQGAKLIKNVSPLIPVFLQPMTGIKSIVTEEVLNPPTPQQVLDWQEHMKTIISDVRVVPQTHRFIGQI
jgi:organic radical activating enzyme